MPERRSRLGTGLSVAVWLVLAGILIPLASAWALAKPGDDPVGRILREVRGAYANGRDWLRPGAAGGIGAWDAASMQIPGGDPVRGARLIQRYGCGACHVVPGIARASGTVGPSLTGLRDRAYIAGILPNRPGALADWLMSPPRFAPRTAMPDMGVTESEARDMVAYLYTLEGR